MAALAGFLKERRMSIRRPLIPALRQMLAKLVERLARRGTTEPGRPAAAATLGAFGLLASGSDPHRD